MPACRADDAELQLAGRDALDHGMRVRHGQEDADVGILALELAEHQGHGDRSRPCRRAEHELARECSFSRGADLRDELILECEHALRPAVETPAGLRRLDTSPRAVEQLRPQTLLECADLERHRRLGDAEALGRLREAPPLHHRAERGELARVHK